MVVLAIHEHSHTELPQCMRETWISCGGTIDVRIINISYIWLARSHFTLILEYEAKQRWWNAKTSISVLRKAQRSTCCRGPRSMMARSRGPSEKVKTPHWAVSKDDLRSLNPFLSKEIIIDSNVTNAYADIYLEFRPVTTHVNLRHVPEP